MTSEVDQRRRDKQDMQRLIGLIMASPIGDKKMIKVDGEISFTKLAQAENTDVRTRMLLKIARDAMDGDLKCADFLMKYGGFEPPKEAEITFEIPTFIDDMPIIKDVTNAVDQMDDKELEELADAAKEAKALPEPDEDVVTDDEDIIVCDVSKKR